MISKLKEILWDCLFDPSRSARHDGDCQDITYSLLPSTRKCCVCSKDAMHEVRYTLFHETDKAYSRQVCRFLCPDCYNRLNTKREGILRNCAEDFFKENGVK